MLINSEPAAGEALEQIGQLQRSAEAGDLGGGRVGDHMVERAEGVVEYFLAMGSTNVYVPLVEPLMGWALYSMAPISLLEPETRRGIEARAVYDSIKAFFEKYSYLKT